MKGMAIPLCASRFCSRAYVEKDRRVSGLPAGRVASHGDSRAASARRSAYHACASVRRIARRTTVSAPPANPRDATAGVVSVTGQANRCRRARCDRNAARTPAPREWSTAQASSSRQCSVSPATTV